MSFKQNDTNDNINLGNYEEFFVLYMDNELSDEQMQMVDAFLLAHPDLQAEFEMLAGTKLLAEDLAFDKTELFADTMKLNVIGEDLLLYIDNELPADKTKVVELEIASNKDYKLQHTVLMQTKLDANERIEYPNKKELYRRTERRIGFQPWMRIAAAVIVILALGAIYVSNNSAPAVGGTGNSSDVANNAPGKKADQTKALENKTPVVPVEDVAKNSDAGNKSNENPSPKNIITPSEKKTQEVPKDLIADNGNTGNGAENTNRATEAENSRMTSERDVAAADVTVRTLSFSNVVNKPLVTSANPITLDPITTPNETVVAAPNESKGSVKGFLRKATRMIEKRTGIEATNDDGKILIGAVAINLN